MSRMVRFMVPVDPDNVQATAQAMYDAVQKQMAGSEAGGDAKQRQMGGGHDWTPEEVEQLSKGLIPGGFAGPNKSYPVGSAQDVTDAWNLSDLATDPTLVRFNLKAIAKRNGWQHALPAAAYED